MTITNIVDSKKIRILCILLVLKAVVSYRSVPRILNLFNTQTSLKLGWTPHFTSIINWTLRLGLGLLKQVDYLNKPWIAIIDHSIDIGTKKALVVLRVPMDTLLQQKQAIRLKDCECIGLKISEKVNGESISLELKEIFEKSGIPSAIVKDCDRTLAKGVRLCFQEQDIDVPIIDDIGHCVANALKAQFKETKSYNRFISLITKGSRCLWNTDLAFLIPPKLRSKGRFQNVNQLGKWGSKILVLLSAQSSTKKMLQKLRSALPGFRSLKPFIEHFAHTTKISSQIMKIVKNKGLDKSSYKQCQKLLKELPRSSKTRKHLRKWFQKHFEIQQKLTTMPLLASSDIIESLFGNFKHVIERSPRADMNRMALLIPAFCGQRDEVRITQVLNQVQHNELAKWERENIPYTIRKKRLMFFK